MITRTPLDPAAFVVIARHAPFAGASSVGHSYEVSRDLTHVVYATLTYGVDGTPDETSLVVERLVEDLL